MLEKNVDEKKICQKVLLFYSEMLSSLRCLDRILMQNKSIALLKDGLQLLAPVASTKFHTCSTKFVKFGEESGTRTWNLHNEKVFSPDNPVPRVSCNFLIRILNNVGLTIRINMIVFSVYLPC
jgi:hypothetical protein